ncbi:carbohydrate sulfotransferase 1-like isoform X2 [Pecten maximus]|uniref:carbohydrate sulfotransferase 1-like isoform X2 n=1 Tax=Pecten maximus TaxID=6579 RepID=UPI001458B30C|nr:carbohydrate sulfotransferase 1-like isoform X2 [Pecten maximus]
MDYFCSCLWPFCCGTKTRTKMKVKETRQKWNKITEKDQVSGNFEGRSNVTPGSKDGYQILLLTYLRSGSTFLGDIVQQVPRALYSYEPARHYMARRQSYISLERGTCDFANDSCSHTSSQEYNTIMENIQNFYKCDLHHLHPFLRRGMSTTSGRQCHHEAERKRCISEMLPYCQSGTRIVKTIRLSMDVVDVLMEKFPNLKVIHLLRDPRGMIVSRMRTIIQLHLHQGDMSTSARAVCDRYNRDIRIGQSLDVKYPNRIKTVLYEQIVEKPLETSLRIFKFLGQQPNNNFKSWMSEHISGDNKFVQPTGYS